MSGLTIIQQGGGRYIDSRDVAEAIGKLHHHLLRDIRYYLNVMEKRGVTKNGCSSFFLESSYTSEQNKEMPCYLVSKMGCEMVANKLTGEKGVLFTAAYVSKFNEMETRERMKQAALYHPRLGEFNAAARLIITAMREAGAVPKQVVEFLRNVYEPLGITVITEGLNAPRTWSASEIAKMLGVMSASGRPHNLAVSAVIYMIGLDKRHISLVPIENGSYSGVCVRYDNAAAALVKDWFEEHGYPAEIKFGNRVFRLNYAQ